MSTPAIQVIAEMIESHLQQGWAALGDEKYVLAKHHFQRAIEKVDELATVTGKAEEPETPKAQQLIIDV